MTAALQRYLNIRREEIAPTLASALSFFCILTALMVLRPARGALGMQRSGSSIAHSRARRVRRSRSSFSASAVSTASVLSKQR
jgi:hypothetical protein